MKRIREKLLERANADLIQHNSLKSAYYLTYRYLVSNIKSVAPIYLKGRMLDIGCGNKPYFSLIEPYVQEYVGLDLEQSSEKLVDVIGSAVDLPFDKESFDSLFSSQVLEHIFDHNKVISECHRVLKKGGYFVCSVPMIWPLHEIPHDYYRFTKYSLQELANKNAFELVKCINCGGKWAVIAHLLVLFLLLPVPSNILLKYFCKAWNLIMAVSLNYWGSKVGIEKADRDLLTINYLAVFRKK